MPTRISTPIKKNDFDFASQKLDISNSQNDLIDSDIDLLVSTTNLPKSLLIEVRRDIDDYRERLSKLEKLLVGAVTDYDKNHDTCFKKGD